MGASDRSAGELITVQEVRHVHHLAMGLVWQVSPHPDATDAESPGNFRRHNIQPFPEGMVPPDWPLVPSALDAWVSRANGLARTLKAGGLLPEALAGVHDGFEQGTRSSTATAASADCASTSFWCASATRRSSFSRSNERPISGPCTKPTSANMAPWARSSPGA